MNTAIQLARIEQIAQQAYDKALGEHRQAGTDTVMAIAAACGAKAGALLHALRVTLGQLDAATRPQTEPQEGTTWWRGRLDMAHGLIEAEFDEDSESWEVLGFWAGSAWIGADYLHADTVDDLKDQVTQAVTALNDEGREAA